MPLESKINLLIINTLYAPFRKGGAEVSVQAVAESLVAKGHTVTVLTLSDAQAISERINGVNVIRWPIDNLYSVFDFEQKQPGFAAKLVWQIKDSFNFSVLRKVKVLLGNSDFDIIWTNNLSGFSSSVWSAAKRANIPVVHTTRDYYLLSNNVQLYQAKHGNISPKGPISWVKQALLQHYAGYISKFVGISHAILSTHARCVPALVGKSAVIYNSVLPALTLATSRPRRSNPKVFGFIGQFNDAKGVVELLDKFQKSKLDATFKVAARVSSEERARFNDPRIEFLGFTSPEDFYAHIDCLLVPSKWREPFGRIVIEAVSYGTPVLCSDSGGLRELAQLFTSVQIVDFAQPIEQILATSVTYSEEDNALLTQHFSNDVIGDEYEKTLLNAIEEKG